MPDTPDQQTEIDPQTPSWGTQAGSGHIEEYSPGRFYIRSTNKHNHGSSVTVGQAMKEQFDFERIKLPPELLARMAALVADPTFPYKSHQDLIRDALHHRVCQIAERSQDHDFLNNFSMELLKQRIAQQTFEDTELAATIEYLDATAEVYVKDQNPDGIADIIHHAKNNVVPQRLKKQWRKAIRHWKTMKDRAET